MEKGRWVLLVCGMLIAAPAFAQAPTPTFELRVAPVVSWPAWDSNLYGMGAGAAVSARFGILPGLFLGPDVGYTLQMLQYGGGSLSVASLGIGIDYELRPLPWLVLSPYAQAGYFLGALSGASGVGGESICLGGGLRLGLSLSPAFILGADAGYTNYYGLYQAVDFGMDANIRLGAARNSGEAVSSTKVLTMASAPGTAAGPFELSVDPGASWPAWDSGLYGIGGGGTLSARFGLFGSGFRIGPEVGYALQPLQDGAGELSLFAFGAGAAYEIRPTGWLALSPFVQGGYFVGSLPGSAGALGMSAYLGGGLRIDLPLGPAFGVGLEGGYKYYYGLFQAIDFGLVASLSLGASSGSQARPAAPQPEKPRPQLLKATAPTPSKTATPAAGLELADLGFSAVFPVLFKYYDDHPIGKVSIKNSTGAPVQSVKVSFFVNQYMDNPKVCATIPSMDPGANETVDLLALFNDNMLGISEGTKVSAKVTVDWLQSGAPVSQETTGTIRIYDRNASMWDDNRKAAAFVTSKDPTILRFSKNVLAMVKGKGSKAVNPNLLTAMAMHEATLLYGLTYVTDPSNSYAATLESKTAVDFLQFPRQTLDYKGGNCSALSILYSALLESVGIETAFITVPGHIFMAVSLGISPDQARKEFSAPDDLILTKDRAWLPIETTERSAGFLQAWQDGAKEWRENLARQQADLYPVHEAWAVYEPVGFASDTENIPLPDGDKLVAAYLEELVHYIDSEIYPQVAKLQADIRSTNNSPKSVNELGVLYARYGLYDRAEVQFKAALKGGTYAPALVNLGNLAYLGQKFDAALDYYNQAQKVEPANPTVLLAVARVNHALENYGVAKAAYDKLKAAAPDLAQQFAYLDLKGEESTRAADIAGVNDVVVWGEE
jgi:tetratricopeptide (TPR) repeat protein